MHVTAGTLLRFQSVGVWVDAVIPCSADGYPAQLFYATGHPPRIPDDGRYFRLMGRIVPNDVAPTQDDPAQTFPIGAQGEHQAATDGVLFVFANDRAGYYWNNWGGITLTISTGDDAAAG
ncbi:hypothetical protein G3N57_01905 [Paraburkholderia sp. Se-20369]|nr:hypothetical protein [Paraburkholderia sp. Se-20369]